MHRSYEVLDDSESDVADHIFKLLIQAIIEIDLECEKPALFEEDDMRSPEGIARKLGQVQGEALHRYYE